MMRKKLAIFTAAVAFLTLCNVVLYSRRLRTEDEVVAAGIWRMSAASSNGHEKRMLTAALAVASEEWTYGSYNSTSGTSPLPVVTTKKQTTNSSSSSSTTTQVSITTSASKYVSTSNGTTPKRTASSAIQTTKPTTPSFPLSPQNIATTLANRNYSVNGTIVCVEVPLQRSSNRTRKVTFNTALLMEEQNVTTTGTIASRNSNDVLNTSLPLQPSTAIVDGSGNGGIGIDFGANYSGNSSVDVGDVTASIVTTLKVASDAVVIINVSNASNATLPVSASATGGLSPLNEHPFSLMINVDDLCADAANLTLLILVTTAVSHAAHREAIRDTWGGLSKYHPDVRVAFVMGRPQDEHRDESKIVDEALVYADILQEDFLDTYKNLTLKTVMMLKWAQTHCLNAKYVMKTDDDMFINIPNLLKYLRGLRYNRGLLLGRLVRGARPVRSVKSKYYVPTSMYSDKMYPDYLSGTGYVMSPDVVAKLYATSMTTPLFFFEDVFITGICAKKARIVRRNHAGFVFYKRPVKGCAYVRAITGHDNSPNDLRKIWSELTRKNLKC